MLLKYLLLSSTSSDCTSKHKIKDCREYPTISSHPFVIVRLESICKGPIYLGRLLSCQT